MDETPVGWAGQLEHRAARALLRLPPGVKVALCGGRATVRSGLTLHPELQLLLALRRLLRAPEVCTLSPVQARRRLRREALVHAGVPVPVGAVRDLVLETKVGPLKARHYAPLQAAKDAPLLVFFHGGGFVLGDLDTHDPPCRVLCSAGGVHVLSVEYRLAPEQPFPAALDDARAAFEWAAAHAQELGADPARIAVGGDSAGGNISAVVCQLLAKDGAPLPAAQLLLYPVVDRTVCHGSMNAFAEGFFLTRAEVDWYHAQYAGSVGADPFDPRISPLLSRELSGLPPALVVTAGFDPLRDEGEAYADALQRAGTPAVLRRFDGLVHGFANMVGVSAACRDALDEVASLLREQLLQRAPAAKAASGGGR